MATLPPSTNLPPSPSPSHLPPPASAYKNAFPFLFSRQQAAIIVAESSMEMLYYLLEFPFAFLFLRWLTAAAFSSSSSASSSMVKQRGGGDNIDIDDGAVDRMIGREEMEIVMGAIGLQERGGGGGQSAMESCSAEQLCGLFEEKEPSLEEVKEAFLVFDENGDGFIEAAELQSVLRKLGFAEGAELEECREMIRVHDENGDGKIGFSEFVKFLELGFC